MAVAGRLRLQTREVGKVLVLDLSGDVTMGEESTALRRLLRGQLDDNRGQILLNLAEVNYMDSTAVGVLVEAQAHAIGIGAELRLSNAPQFILKILRELNLVEILGVHPTEGEALASFR